MIDLENVDIKFDLEAEGTEDVHQCLKTLFSTPVGTVPFDRDFGIDWSVLDNPMELVKGLLTVEYIDKVRKYEPRVRVSKVTFEADSAIGILKPKVVVELES